MIYAVVRKSAVVVVETGSRAWFIDTKFADNLGGLPQRGKIPYKTQEYALQVVRRQGYIHIEKWAHAAVDAAARATGRQGDSGRPINGEAPARRLYVVRSGDVRRG